MTINPDGRRQGLGVPASPSGYSAEPEPCSTVSAVPVSIPNAAPLRQIMLRNFVAYVGTEVTLTCGHKVFVNPRRANRCRSLRCQSCGERSGA